MTRFAQKALIATFEAVISENRSTFKFRMIWWPENNKKVNTTRRMALALLVYTCLFVLDDTPYTSVWNNLSQTEVEQLICGEEQEESLAMVSLIKTRLRTTPTVRSSVLPDTYLSIVTSLTKTNSSLQIQSHLAVSSLQRKRSIDYCVFQV